VEAVQKAARESGLYVIPGMELQTQEEVHMLCLFDTLEQLKSWQAVVDQHLPLLENNPDFFGEQFIVDETGDFIRSEGRLLITSSRLSLDDAFFKVTELGGLAIPAHVDREAFGLFANLGFVPPELPLDALEISRRMTIAAAQQKFPSINKYPLIHSGDVHYLADYFGANLFHISTPSIRELRRAFHQEEGRWMKVTA
jgi:3',5'-nucleoside bisphosphate phosphatase